MSTNRNFDRIAEAWLAEGPSQLADRVLDAALDEVHLTNQRRRLPVPWRFTLMPALSRATGIAALALVAVVGAGGLISLNSKAPSGPGGPTTAPTAAPTPGASEVAPGITAWTTYTSEIHGFTLGYPEDWSVNAPATRKWQTGDEFPGDVWPYADTFVGPGEGDASIGLFVWEMPLGEGVDPESVEGMKAWAEAFCNNVGVSACDAFTQDAVPMCLASVIDPDVVECRGALLVPTDGPQFAFIPDWTSLIFTGIPDVVTVVVIGREDSFPSAARYDGSVELLKSILTTMDVWTPGQVPIPYPG
jgi:hypothetical protein